MTISEALEIARAKATNQQPYEIGLGCSFTPLHVQTFLAAHCKLQNPALNVTIKPGIYGDFVGTIETLLANQSVQALAIVLEWQDFDTRFNYREAGQWGPVFESDLATSMAVSVQRMEAAIERTASTRLTAVSLPTLPLPPAFHTSLTQASETELWLRQEIAALAFRLSKMRNVRVLNSDWLDEESPFNGRLDLKSDLLIGSPYTLTHADAVASGLARLLFPAQPLKGIITDLDDTFWSGIVGEVGPEAVRWDSASSYHLHGLYQKTLCALADEGVLIGIASKNDGANVETVFKRDDILIPAKKIFPIEVHWAPKSESVSRILRAWNISADAVAFVDDAPLELAEVSAVHPGITCLPFPTGDYKGVLALLKKLRDLFGKGRLTEEDAFRLDSIRQGAAFREGVGQPTSEDFLSQVQSVITLDWEAATNPRILDLVNKTNQFNLNGIRFTASEWERGLVESNSFLIAATYEDKFGRLGTIAVIRGRADERQVYIDTWVMSCRAFSRRVEHQCLRAIFERFQVPQIGFQFAPTAKNGPLREFFETLSGTMPGADFTLSREQFAARCPALHHRLEQVIGVNANG